MVATTRPKMAIEDLLHAKEQERLQKIKLLGDKMYGSMGKPQITEKASKLQPSMNLVTRLYELPLEKSRARSTHSLTRSHSRTPSNDQNSRLGSSNKKLKAKLNASSSQQGLNLTNSNLTNSVSSIYRNYAQDPKKNPKSNRQMRTLAGEPLQTVDQLLDDEMESKKRTIKKATSPKPGPVNNASARSSNSQQNSFSKTSKEPWSIGGKANKAEKGRDSVQTPPKHTRRLSPTFSGEKSRMPNFMFFGKTSPSNMQNLAMTSMTLEREQPSFNSSPKTASAIGLGELGFSKTDSTPNSAKLKPTIEKSVTASRFKDAPAQNGNTSEVV